MLGKLIFWLNLLYLSKLNATKFFHENSYVEFIPDDVEGKIDFGYTMGYHKTYTDLVVGAPKRALDGAIFLCSINEEIFNNKKTKCINNEIGLNDLVPERSRSGSPEQNFCLGASITVTQDYIFTCAPLITLDLPIKLNKSITQYGPYGTCFITNDSKSTTRYMGMLEQYQKEIIPLSISMDDYYGGVGWTTLSYKNLILISKPMMPKANIYFMDTTSNTVKMANLRNAMDDTYLYKGRALAPGVFFNNHQTLYAFSAEKNSRSGIIGFLYYTEDTNEMNVLKNDKLVLIQEGHGRIASMFGASLHSVDINLDSFQELLVGAPTQDSIEGGYENGAIHIYKGGSSPKSRYSSDLHISSTKDASRFGTAIASADIDGDEKPEIFVSAPYEDEGKGAVYILSGHRINELLTGKMNNIALSDIADTQRLQNPSVKSLGFSLQVFHGPNFGTYGQHILAMGSPLSNSVVLYRSIPFVEVELMLRDTKSRVREQDTSFTVSVFVLIKYPPQSQKLSGKLLITTTVDSNSAWIENNTFELVMPNASLSRDVTVFLRDTDPGIYKFTATVEIDSETYNKKDFDSSLVSISPKFLLTNSVNVSRQCNKEDCIPKLSPSFEWSGSKTMQYLLGSSSVENLTVIVHNEGSPTFGNYANIQVTGAKIELLSCDNKENNSYKCNLPIIPRHKDFTITIQFDMRSCTNRDKALVVDIDLYTRANESSTVKSVSKTKIINYVLNTDDIYLGGLEQNQKITDRQIKDEDPESVIEIYEIYTITNNGTVLWSSIPISISLQKQPFIVNYSIPAELTNCAKTESENYITHNCIIDLIPNFTTKIQTTVSIGKDEILDNLKDAKLTISSDFVLVLDPLPNEIRKSYSTDIIYEEDQGFGQNITLIIIISILVALILMAVSIFILYKAGFFKREDKTKLQILKERRESVRRANNEKAEMDTETRDQDGDNISTGSSHSKISAINIEVVDDDIELRDLKFKEPNDLTELIEKDGCRSSYN